MYEILILLAAIGVFNAVNEIIKYYKRNKVRREMIEDFEKKHPGPSIKKN